MNRPDNDEAPTINWRQLCLLLFSLLCIALIVALLAQAVRGESVKLAWNPNPETDIAGYVLHYGTDGMTATQPTGNVTSYTLAGLAPATTYTIAVQAVNTSGLTSGLSAPITHTTAAAAPPPLDMTGSTVHAVSSQEILREPTPATAAIDGKYDTFWHTKWETLPPHYIAIKLPRAALASGFYYEPRLDGESNGHIIEWEIQSSMDGITWEAWETGTFANDASGKFRTLPMREVRYFRLWGNERYAAATELKLAGTWAAPPSTTIRTIQHSLDLKTWTDLVTLPGPAPDKEFIRIKRETPP